MDSLGTAAVTGASTGIGAVYADRLARRGYDLVLVARQENRLRAVAAAIAQATGRSTDTLPAHILMDAEAMVDAALAGLDAGEGVTIPSLPDMAAWDTYQAARRALLPNLSRSTPAPRYRMPAAKTAGAQ